MAQAEGDHQRERRGDERRDEAHHEAVPQRAQQRAFGERLAVPAQGEAFQREAHDQ